MRPRGRPSRGEAELYKARADSQREFIVKLMGNGLSTAEIAIKLQLTHKEIGKILKGTTK